jgi:seryl-tRNA synthetase
MDASTVDQEFEQLQAEFQDVAKTVQALAEKMKTAEKAGDTNATEWLADLQQVAKDIDDEQDQVKKLLLAIHDFVGTVAQPQAAGEDKPPLFALGHEPTQDDPAQQQHHGMLGGLMGGGMMGGGMLGGGSLGGYYGGGFGRAMEMGMAMNLGANLVSSIFRL